MSLYGGRACHARVAVVDTVPMSPAVVDIVPGPLLLLLLLLLLEWHTIPHHRLVAYLLLVFPLLLVCLLCLCTELVGIVAIASIVVVAAISIVPASGWHVWSLSKKRVWRLPGWCLWHLEAAESLLVVVVGVVVGIVVGLVVVVAPSSVASTSLLLLVAHGLLLQVVHHVVCLHLHGSLLHLHRECI